MDYISPISSAVMAVVWIVYFQLFFLFHVATVL